MGDQEARQRAVEPQRSVIVQAPAGSGKTTLLVERYLGLLGVVEAPEDILAITFTRKAAAEMRERVLGYLDPEYETDEPHAQAALAKARAVADKVAAWHLLENPQRLLIRTIDSFNHYLARTMPVASQLGPVPAPADNARALYRQAARTVLSMADGNHALAPQIHRLLDWRDHRRQDIENLLADLLGRRDQWLRALNVAGGGQRAQLEAVLQAMVEEQLQRSARLLTHALRSHSINQSALLELLQFAATNLIEASKSVPLTAFASANNLPDARVDSLALWRGLASLWLLKDSSSYRTEGAINKSLGFASGTPQRTEMQQILAAVNSDTALAAALNAASQLPAPAYQEDDWQVLDALIEVLLQAAGELELLFARSGQTDYTGLANAALRGLGDEETGYTDLALYLDRRIQHILVDEFQDTNWSQLHLLEKLTAGWEPDDGRSLFAVGDPTQSIYRFREAEVGLFIRSRDQGIGQVALESAQLRQNFRSRSEIVQWVNAHLGPIFPQQEDISAGAVAYVGSEPGRASGGAVTTLASTSDAQEADAIAALLAETLKEQEDNPDYKAAIIVRARSHLQAILPALVQRGIPFRAVKLDPLTSTMVVQDLLAITRLILQPADTTALLAVLRSPVCGLTLAELVQLAGDGHSPLDPQALDRLEGPARARAQSVFTALADAQSHWQRRPLRELVEGVWQRLGGPQCCTKPETDLRDAGIYLDALEQADAQGQLADWNDFRERLDGAYTQGDPPDAAVKLEVLTMHSAKGLEWDLVVLPALNKKPPNPSSALLNWLPFTQTDGAEQVLMAPLKSAQTKGVPPLVQLIRNEQQQRAAYENQRLLYVATTRAREALILSAQIEIPESGTFTPTKRSLLADLWPTTETAFMEAALSQANTAADSAAKLAAPVTPTLPDQILRRVADNWQPTLGERLPWSLPLSDSHTESEIEYDWAGKQARTTGTVLHRLLERVGNIGYENLRHTERERLGQRIPLLLRALGTEADQLEQASAIIQQAFEQTLDSAVGQWLLSGQHAQSACELAISGYIDGELINAVVDRTFVDSDGVRWIIDYKSGFREGADLAGFFAQEAERYRGQLNRYRALMAQLEPREIRTALFLPRHLQLEEVAPEPDLAF